MNIKNNENECGTLTRISIKEIDGASSIEVGLIVIGVVIAKQFPRTFSDKKGNGSRSVFGFTLRDSPSDIINCVVWGSEEYNTNIAKQFSIGDVVELHKFQPQIKSDDEEKYNPTTTSSFTLHLGERSNSEIFLHDDLHGTFEFLRHAIIRPDNDYYKISEIHEQGQAMNGQNINLLAVVKKVGRLQNLTAKSGRKLSKLEVFLFDDTCPNFSLLFWDLATAEYALSWCDRNTVIFAADVRVAYNEYKQSMTATASSKSVFITNPDSNESHRLYQFAKQYAEQVNSLYDDSIEMEDDNEPDIYTVEKLLQFGERVHNDSFERSTFNANVIRATVFGALTNFNIDGPGEKIWSYRCAHCRYRLSLPNAEGCPNNQCPSITEGMVFNSYCSYDMLIAISDHTGSLENCRLGGRAAEKMFGMTVSEFQNLPDKAVVGLKWQWMLERCKVRVRCSFEREKPFIRIEHIERANPIELLHASTL